MKKKIWLDWWCGKAWILFGCRLTAIMTVLIMLNWRNWFAELKTVAAIAALIPVHVVEEWVFPGGFHFQYNTFLYQSNQPDRYPMCRKLDMITNLGATFMYMAITFACVLNGNEVSTGILMGTIGFCAMELAVHTTFGTLAYFKYRGKGKCTIYDPSSITAYLGFGVFGVILCYEMPGRAVTGHDWLICAAILSTILVVWILIPENLIKKKDNEYFFPTNGYYDRYLK